MKTSSRFVTSILTLLLVAGTARADLFDQLGLSKKKDPAQTTNSAVAALSEGQVVQGLKEALGKGLQQAIGRLGHEGGFLTNLNVKIPLPEKVRSVEKTLRAVKQEKPSLPRAPPAPPPGSWS